MSSVLFRDIRLHPVDRQPRAYALLPDASLACDGEFEGLPEPKNALVQAEARARQVQRKCSAKAPRGNDRQLAESLHREADACHHRGDYETALILYHRASRLRPRDDSYIVAVRRTVAAIESATNPSRVLSKLLPKVKTDAQLATALCPESAALKATFILRQCVEDRPETIAKILRYFDCREDFLKMKPTNAVAKITRSKIVQRQITGLAEASLRNAEASYAAGNFRATLKSAKELLGLTLALHDAHSQIVTAYHFIALSHVGFGRHDRAVDAVASMVHWAKRSGDVVLKAKSLVTLGKVHLSFGHLDAAAKAWQRLAGDLEEPVPRAWVQHEIGRCHLESGNYPEALIVARRCLESAEEAESKKWLLHGKLLYGQVLAKLGRFGEALQALKVAEKITEEEGDTPTLSYIRDLIDRVAEALKKFYSAGLGSAGTAGSVSATPGQNANPSFERIEKTISVNKVPNYSGKIMVSREIRRGVERAAKNDYSNVEEQDSASSALKCNFNLYEEEIEGISSRRNIKIRGTTKYAMEEDFSEESKYKDIREKRMGSPFESRSIREEEEGEEEKKEDTGNADTARTQILKKEENTEIPNIDKNEGDMWRMRFLEEEAEEKHEFCHLASDDRFRTSSLRSLEDTTYPRIMKTQPDTFLRDIRPPLCEFTSPRSSGMKEERIIEESVSSSGSPGSRDTAKTYEISSSKEHGCRDAEEDFVATECEKTSFMTARKIETTGSKDSRKNAVLFPEGNVFRTREASLRTSDKEARRRRIIEELASSSGSPSSRDTKKIHQMSEMRESDPRNTRGDFNDEQTICRTSTDAEDIAEEPARAENDATSSPLTLYRHSLPSTPRRDENNKEICVCEGFTAAYDPSQSI